MAISGKPPRAGKTPESVEANEQEVRALIGKGGTVPKEEASVSEAGRKNVQLRLEASVIARIDGAITQRLVPVSRHVWLLEAIAEKLQREEG